MWTGVNEKSPTASSSRSKSFSDRNKTCFSCTMNTTHVSNLDPWEIMTSELGVDLPNKEKYILHFLFCTDCITGVQAAVQYFLRGFSASPLDSTQS